MKSIFSMRQVVFFGFAFGFLGSAFALRSSLRHLELPELGRTVLKWGFFALFVESLLFGFFNIHPAVHFLASGVGGKLGYDIWLMRPAMAYKHQGGTDGDIIQTIFMGAICLAVWVGVVGILVLVDYLATGEVALSGI